MFSCPSPSCRHSGSRFQTSEQRIRAYLCGKNAGSVLTMPLDSTPHTPDPSPPPYPTSSTRTPLTTSIFTTSQALFLTLPLLPYPYHSNDRPTPPPPLWATTRHGGGPGRPAAASRRPSRRACGPPSSPTRPDSWRTGGRFPHQTQKKSAHGTQNFTTQMDASSESCERCGTISPRFFLQMSRRGRFTMVQGGGGPGVSRATGKWGNGAE